MKISRFLFLGLMPCVLGLTACTPLTDDGKPKAAKAFNRAPMDRPGMKGRKDLL